jgi:phage gp29-like protein
MGKKRRKQKGLSAEFAENSGPVMGEIASAANDVAHLGRFADELAESRDDIVRTHGSGDLRLYRRIARDDQVYATWQQRKAATVSRTWHVDPGAEDAASVRAADFWRENLKSLQFDSITWKMLNGIFYGPGYGECMYAADSGLIYLDKVKVRQSHRFAWGRDGALFLLRPGGRDRMPERKFWTFVAGAEDDDDLYGIGLGHYLYWPVWLKRNSIRFWALWQEKFASPTPVARGPSGMTNDEERKLLSLLSAITSGGRIVIPKHIELELLKVLNDSGDSYERFVNLLNAAISKIVVGQTMTTDNGSSRAQATVHMGVLDFVAKTDADLICSSFSDGPVRWITEWNFPGATPPTVWRDFADELDLDQRASRDVKIKELGFRPTEQYIRETYGDGYERMPAPDPGAPTGPDFAEPLDDTRTSVEELLTDGWQRVMGPEVERLEQLTDGASSLEEVRDRLGEVGREHPEQLTEALARVMFAARVAGVVEAEELDSGDS